MNHRILARGPVQGICVLALACFSLGCAQTTALRNQAVFSGRAAMDAVSPIFDPAGGSVTSEGRSIEQNLSRAGRI